MPTSLCWPMTVRRSKPLWPAMPRMVRAAPSSSQCGGSRRHGESRRHSRSRAAFLRHGAARPWPERFGLRAHPPARPGRPGRPVRLPRPHRHRLGSPQQCRLQPYPWHRRQCGYGLRPDPRPSLARPRHRGDPARDRPSAGPEAVFLRRPRRRAAAPRRRHRPRYPAQRSKGQRAGRAGSRLRAGRRAADRHNRRIFGRGGNAHPCQTGAWREPRHPLQLRLRRPARGRLRAQFRPHPHRAEPAYRPGAFAQPWPHTPTRPDLRRHHPDPPGRTRRLALLSPRSRRHPDRPRPFRRG